MQKSNLLDRDPPRRGLDRFGENIKEIIEKFSLKDACRVIFPNDKYFTFLTAGSKSRIDKIIVSHSFDVIDYYHEICNLSDHVIVISKLQLKGKFEKGYGVWKNNTSIFQNKIFLSEFEKLWNYWKFSLFDECFCPLTYWIWAKKGVKNFLLDIGKQVNTQKKNLVRNDYDFIFKYGASDLEDNESNVRKFLATKKRLAKMEMKIVKEKMNLSKCKDFLEGDKPTFIIKKHIVMQFQKITES